MCVSYMCYCNLSSLPLNMCYSGVHIEGEDILLGETRHVRGAKGKKEEYTCEILRFYDQTATGDDVEKVADVRWYYQPKELKRIKVKNIPDKFLPNEVIVSDDYSPVSVESITTKCQVMVFDAYKTPDKAALGDKTLYCRWRLVKEDKNHLVPAIPVTPKLTETQSTKRESSKKTTEVINKRNTKTICEKTLKQNSERKTRNYSWRATETKATVSSKKVTEVKKALTKTLKAKQKVSSLPRKVKAGIKGVSDEKKLTPFESARERYASLFSLSLIVAGTYSLLFY